jgi:hypothetical protein
MNTAQQIEIPLSKFKLTLLFLVSLVFIGCGIWLLTSPPKTNNSILSNPTTVFILGLVSIIFSGLIGFYAFKKLWDKTPGLIISDQGIFDNASMVCAGFIPWTDIVEIREMEFRNQKLIDLAVKNPQAYIDRHKGVIKRKLLQINYNMSGIVIGIPSTGLKCSYKELKLMIDRKWEEHKAKTV